MRYHFSNSINQIIEYLAIFFTNFLIKYLAIFSVKFSLSTWRLCQSNTWQFFQSKLNFSSLSTWQFCQMCLAVRDIAMWQGLDIIQV